MRDIIKGYIDNIDGYKTYIVAGVVAAFTFAKMVGWITGTEFESIMGFLGAIGLFTLRDAINKVE